MIGVRPYFVPVPGTVEASPWLRAADDGWEPLEDWIPDWDYRTRLSLRCTVKVDLEAVKASTGLLDGAPLLWSIGWRATDSKLVVEPVMYEAVDGTVDIDLQIDPDRAGAGIMVTRRLVLGRDRMHATAGEPRWAGSVLWEDECHLRLTGQGSAFPTEVVDFDSLGRDARASWFLELPVSPDVAAMGSFLLLINSADTDLVGAVTAGTRAGSTQRALLDSMFEGVVQEIVRWALSRWSELTDAEPDSAGANAHILTRRVLPDADAWTGPDIDSMALREAVTAGARDIGFGRRLS